MAESPSHKFGQWIGNLVESVTLDLLDGFCRNKNLYLDHQNRNRSFRRGKKVSWTDGFGNTHDLDFVIERNGSETVRGEPVAFIESAWRRYTKHSRNKAQEIQGAILPLAQKFRWNNPFLGAVLAGFFTDNSQEQLITNGFKVLFIPYESIIDAFHAEGLEIEFDEDTPDAAFRDILTKTESLTPDRIQCLKERLIARNRESIDSFLLALEERLKRYVTRITIIPLYGNIHEFTSVEEVLRFLNGHSVYENTGHFRKYEIKIEFSNGDYVQASIASKEKAIEFINFVVCQ